VHPEQPSVPRLVQLVAEQLSDDMITAVKFSTVYEHSRFQLSKFQVIQDLPPRPAMVERHLGHSHNAERTEDSWVARHVACRLETLALYGLYGHANPKEEHANRKEVLTILHS
jgi:hypothetical protein